VKPAQALVQQPLVKPGQPLVKPVQELVQVPLQMLEEPLEVLLLLRVQPPVVALAASPVPAAASSKAARSHHLRLVGPPLPLQGLALRPQEPPVHNTSNRRHYRRTPDLTLTHHPRQRQRCRLASQARMEGHCRNPSVPMWQLGR
jgi:hypothetical protein